LTSDSRGQLHEPRLTEPPTRALSETTTPAPAVRILDPRHTAATNSDRLTTQRATRLAIGLGQGARRVGDRRAAEHGCQTPAAPRQVKPPLHGRVCSLGSIVRRHPPHLVRQSETPSPLCVTLVLVSNECASLTSPVLPNPNFLSLRIRVIA
jgi:hypothetical protein